MNKRFQNACLTCGKLFDTDDENDLFCSKHCKDIYRPSSSNWLYWEDDMSYKNRNKNRFGDKLKEMKKNGLDYIEEQKKESIEMFARIDVKEFMKNVKH